jgi:hypothetical protein
MSSRVYTLTAATSVTRLTLDVTTGTNYFAVTAHTIDGLESLFSDEVSWVVKPTQPTRLRILGAETNVAIIIEQSADFENWTAVGTVFAPSTNSRTFYRSRRIESSSQLR